jgi:hypothetical protein
MSVTIMERPSPVAPAMRRASVVLVAHSTQP